MIEGGFEDTGEIFLYTYMYQHMLVIWKFQFMVVFKMISNIKKIKQKNQS